MGEGLVKRGEGGGVREVWCSRRGEGGKRRGEG